MRRALDGWMKLAVHFGRSLLCSCVSGKSDVATLRPPLRGWLRSTLPPSLRLSVGPKGPFFPPQRGLRARPLADIPTPLPTQDTFKEVLVMFSIHLFSASPALDTCATTSALARQRFSITSANEIALVLATPPPQPITGSALAPQRFTVNRSLTWGSA